MAAAARFPEPVYVTRPNLPLLDALMQALEPAWEERWLTNSGGLHARLESELARVLGTPHLSLFCNGTVALLTALKAMCPEPGVVITTAFTFPATVNTLFWCGLRPEFCDIRQETYNLDPNELEALITPETRAILPVHVYGTPCDVAHIQAVADRHGLPVIYDAAHAFGVRLRGQSILSFGAASMLSFHATKVFTTAEGGALATQNPELFRRFNLLRNFGIVDEETVVAPGINGKMNELQAALGLTQLESIEANTLKRRRIAALYGEQLAGEPGLSMLSRAPDVDHNYAYFPVRIQRDRFGMDRDALHRLLKEFNIHGRKYFYPLCSTHPWCRVPDGKLPRSEAAAAEVLCLPIYSALPEEWASSICVVIKELGALARSLSADRPD